MNREANSQVPFGPVLPEHADDRNPPRGDSLVSFACRHKQVYLSPTEAFLNHGARRLTLDLKEIINRRLAAEGCCQHNLAMQPISGAVHSVGAVWFFASRREDLAMAPE